GADAVTESIVKDCSINERLQFEELLGKLDSKLSQAQLVELERLFGRCGAFFSERKSVMVAKLVREVEILNNYVTQLNVILNDENDSDEFLLETWTELAIEEKKRSDQLAELVQLQDKIITALLNGKSVQSTEILGIMQTVKEVQENLTLSNIKATEARAKLITL
ncbi:hypothetical protein KC730_01600, partial [Candidatus Kaiserbacteria bacterium]|nr:hypothetical protein [Candidatus Kaiserbacteria bacterium]